MFHRLAIHLCLWAGLVAVAVSCGKGPALPEGQGESVPVTFSIGLPDAARTKAISDGLGATKLLLYAYDANGTYLPALKIEEADAFQTRAATAKLTLVKGMTYSFVFVAVNPGASAYTVSAEDKSLTVDYAALTANDDRYDLFTASLLNYEVTGSFTKNITLTRPFAQVNVGVPEADYLVAKNSGIKVEEITSSYTFSSLGTVYDLLAQKVSSNAAASVTVPAALRPVAEKLVVGANSYPYMAMAYVLVPRDASNPDNRATVDVELTLGVETVSGVAHTLVRGVTNAPIQKNYRTNIVGSLFGVSGTFHIYIDQNFRGDIGDSDGNVELVGIQDWGQLN